MKALVTGAAGFIGSNLAETLLKKNYEVIGVDCFRDYYPRETKEKNLENLQKNENFKLIEADLSKDTVKELENVEVVFHEAAQPGVRYSWENFENYLNDNILATQRLLETCKTSKPRIVFASSSSVYGNTDQLPMNETSKLNPISPYGVTKVACEKLLYAYNKSFKIPAVLLRYFTVYGPRQRPDMAINIFTRKLLNNEKIEIFGSGEQTRDFTFIEDIVNGTIFAGESDLNFEILNIGGGSKIPLKELVQKLEKTTGAKADIIYKEEQRGDMKSTYADISKAKELLGYEPKTKIEDGLKKYVEWFKSNETL